MINLPEEVLVHMGLVTNYVEVCGGGGATKREGGGHVKFYPYQNGGQKTF